MQPKKNLRTLPSVKELKGKIPDRKPVEKTETQKIKEEIEFALEDLMEQHL